MMMKKHVLIVGCKNYPAFSSKRVISGGMEIYVDELVRQLEGHYSFSLISGYSKGSANVRVVSVPLLGGFAWQPISLLMYSLVVSLWLVAKGPKIDLVNAQTPLSGIVGLMLKRLFGIPYIVTVHIFAADKQHVGRLAGTYGAVERLVLRHANRVIAAGHQLKDHLEGRYGFLQGRIIVVNPGMDLPDTVEVEAADKLRSEVEHEDFKILYIGRLVAENGLLDLLRAMTLLKGQPVRLLIAGNGNLEGEVRTFVEREGLGDQVKLLGVVRGHDKQYLFKNVDLSIRTSYHEVFPVAYLESIAFGVPVVATPVGDTEYIANMTGAITLVPTGRPAEVARAIERHMSSGPLSSSVVARCRSFIEGISWPRQAAATEAVFDTALANAAR